MNTNLIHLVRRIVGLITVVLLVCLVWFALITRFAPSAGYQLFTISGGSMEPTIPLGSMVADTAVDPASIVVGDIVTIEADNGVIITHRIASVSDQADGIFFQLKGDANASPDASLVPARAIIGRVSIWVPGAGYVRSFLSSAPGMVAALALVGGLALIYMLVGMLDPRARLDGQDEPVKNLDPVAR